MLIRFAAMVVAAVIVLGGAMAMPVESMVVAVVTVLVAEIVLVDVQVLLPEVFNLFAI